MRHHDLDVLMAGVIAVVPACAIAAPLIDQLLLENLKHRMLHYQYI